MAMGYQVNFNFFSEGCSSEQLFTRTTTSTLLLLVTKVPLEVAWITSITPNGGGRRFPRGWVPCPASWFLRSTTNSFKYPTLTNCCTDLLTPYIVQWYAPYPYDKCGTSYDFFLMGHPPSCLATGSMVHSWFDPQSYAPASWTSHSLPPPMRPIFGSSNPSGAFTKTPLPRLTRD